VARIDDRYEWDYGQRKHQEALRTMQGQVDQSLPHSINPSAQSVQLHTRRFCEDQRRAEIGRENQKLVNRLASIAKGTGGTDPRGPPPIAHMASTGSLQRPMRPTAAVAMAATMSGSFDRPKSLTEVSRRKAQRTIDQDNAALVRRILATASTFDRRADERSFDKHKRTVHLLQRLPPDQSKLRTKQVFAATRPPRLSKSCSLPGRGLEDLLLPWDFHRSNAALENDSGGDWAEQNFDVPAEADDHDEAGRPVKDFTGVDLKLDERYSET